MAAFPLEPARAGFFEDLFGAIGAAFSPQQGQMRPPPQAVPSIRKARKKPAARPNVTVVEKKRRTGLPQALPDLMDDTSLQMGDAVMTKGGVRIFTGSSGSRHRPEDFASLAEVRGLPPRTRSALAEVDANRPDRGSSLVTKAALITGRSASEPHLESGTLITDAKGRTLRYVGP